MIVSAILGAAMVAYAQTPPVPGMCSAPASENRGRPGCYLSAELPVAAGQGDLYWHIRSFDDLESARAEAARHSVATVVEAHGGTWLYVIGAEDDPIGSGSPQGVIGPLTRPTAGPLTVRFLESIFPPGMKTRVHAHPGPEAFFVIEGEQCMDSPTARARIAPGESYILEGGPHLQAAPAGRRNLVALILPADESWMSLSPEWTQSGYCDR